MSFPRVTIEQDHAAGSLIVHEAGGTVTDAHGNPLVFGPDGILGAVGGIVATNLPSGSHRQVIEAAHKEAHSNAAP